MSGDDTSPSLELYDNAGRSFRVRPWRTSDLQALTDFYTTFEPKRAAQGLPPENDARIRRWISATVSRGRHVLVVVEDQIIGHLMLMPIPDRPDACELANFIHQSMRSRGIGTAVNRVGIELARQEGKSYIWLSVEPSNKAAIRSYARAGFRRTSASLWAPEIEMELALAAPAQTLSPHTPSTRLAVLVRRSDANKELAEE